MSPAHVNLIWEHSMFILHCNAPQHRCLATLALFFDSGVYYRTVPETPSCSIQSVSLSLAFFILLVINFPYVFELNRGYNIVPTMPYN